MNEQIIAEHNISSEEKSRKRAEELKASATESKAKLPSLSDEERDALESAIVDELNCTTAIVHTSSTYILIEKSESDFVLDSKSSFSLLYENQIIPELKYATKAHIWLTSP